MLLVAASACENLNWPFHHGRSTPESGPGDSTAETGNDSASECVDLQSEIRHAQETRREAPATSTNPDIVSASQGKADKRIEDLRQRYDELDCPAEDAAARPGRQPPLQPAPGGISR